MKAKTAIVSMFVSLALLLTGSAAAGQAGAGDPPRPAVASWQSPQAAEALSFTNFWLPTSSADEDTEDPTVAVDAAGGVHVVYMPRAFVDGRKLYYAYCASGCGQSENWRAAGIADLRAHGGRASIALTSSGQPRVVYYSQVTTDPPNESLWYYATCDANCLNPANWTNKFLFTTPAETYNNDRYFALDPQGRPRILYKNTGPTGLFYAYCDEECTSSTGTHWYDVQLSGQITADNLALTIDRAGGAHAAFWRAYGSFPYETGFTLTYLECSSGCGASGNWRAAALYDGGTGYTLALRVDALGRPRLAVYAGYRDPQPWGDTLYYAWCNAGCADPANWGSWDVGLPQHWGSHVDLALDGQGRPHMAYDFETAELSGLAYSVCSANCETETPVWEHWIVDDISISNSENHVSLALDQKGNSRIAYDTRGGWGRLVRFAFSNQLNNRSYLPFLHR